jgi:Cof subfamily protein (haloacid dehalogenase superfamily)
MEKVLYISDLDGTLLRKDQTVSPFTAQTICDLAEKGLLFSYATARSYATSSKVTAGLPEKLPVITFNGTFIIETGTGKRLLSNLFTYEEAKQILDRLVASEVYPVVNAFFNEVERFSYLPEKATRGMKKFVEERWNDTRRTPVFSADALYEGEIFHIACMDEEEKLRPLYEAFREEFHTVLYRDLYSGEMWLELHPRGATKATAMLALKNMLGCDKIVCFGDGVNDIPMFQMADKCYAVANAEDSLKRIATDIIESNENDGVAKWLLSNYLTKD